ncbi:major facilitator superfamily domain-containing protein [Dichotomopilus funicola]|uniref:Major facilitator superfamily domain-containing protein n=1 Tax=Dichotomopilus funicola TaxID=1934379 RepID=A0AAN6V418_9PEZI|nr:major facilitator superfamily domain-containing protein [Dichotomopilus funicola]
MAINRTPQTHSNAATIEIPKEKNINNLPAPLTPETIDTPIFPNHPSSSAVGSSGDEKKVEDGQPPERSNNEPAVLTDGAAAQPPPPYSVFNIWEKRAIVFMVSVASFFSPVSANIYFPALNSLAEEYRVSTTLINLTITMYMIFQGLAPSFTGSLSDSVGRRPIYVLCFVIYIGANIGLALQHSFAALMVLRCLQSSGSSGTIALGNAVVTDVASAAERGSYMGYVSLGGVVGVSLGAVVGGILSDFLGWRSIFWFLVICAGVVVLLIALFLPETARAVVGNGSSEPVEWNLSLWDLLPSTKRRRASELAAHGSAGIAKSRSFVNPFLTLKICADKEAGIVLLANGIIFAGYYALVSAIPSQFERLYGFDDLRIGLSFIPVGVSAAISAIAVGYGVDWNFARHCRRLGLSVDEAKQMNRDLGSFPIESVRCEIALPCLALASVAFIVYGWLLSYGTSVAGPLVMLFFVGFGVNGFFTILSVLMVDVYPQAPATATAANNLVRCWIGAGASAVIIPMIDAMTSGWAYTFIALVYLLMAPLLWVVMRWGPRWRAERIAIEKAREANDRNVEP